MATRLSPTKKIAMNASAAQDVRDDQDQPPVEPVDEHAGQAENRTAGTRKVRISALTAVVELVELAMMIGQAEDHHVAADLGERLGEPEEQERSVLEDRQRAALRLDPWAVGASTAAGWVASPLSTVAAAAGPGRSVARDGRRPR